MSDFKLKNDTALQELWNASVGANARKAADYDNSTALDPECDAYLTVRHNTAAPTAGDIVAELWVIYGDAEGTEGFAEGGDGTVGSDFDPQKILSKGGFESVNGSTTATERLLIPSIGLKPGTNRFVLKDLTGNGFHADTKLEIKPTKAQIV